MNPQKYIETDDISVLYSLEDNTAVIKEELAFLKEIYNNKNEDINEIIDKHLEKYDYITIGYGSQPLAKEVLVERYKKIKNMNNNKLKEKIEEIESYPNKIMKQKEEVYKRLNNGQLIELFDLAAKLGIMRDRKKALLGKSVKFRNKIINQIGNKVLEEKENLRYYTMDDFYNLLILGKILDKEEIDKRKEGIYISNISKMTSGMESREEYYNSVKSVDEDVNILKTRKGVCASSGKVIGRARICLTFEEKQ